MRACVRLLLLLLMLASGNAAAQRYCGLPTWTAAVNAAGPGIVYSSREAAQAACNSVAAESADPTSGGWFSRVQKQACTLNQASMNFTVTATISTSSVETNCGATYPASGTRSATGWKFTGPVCANSNETWDPHLQSCIDQRCKNAPVLPTNPNKEGWTSCQSFSGDGGSYSCEALALRQLPTQPYSGYVAWNPTGGKCDPNNYSCPAGYDKREDGTCEPRPQCPEGVPYDPEKGACIQPDQCPTGMMKDPSGACVPERNVCPAGQVKGPDGSCIEDSNPCGQGYAKGKDGACKPDSDGDGTPDTEEEGSEGDDGEHKAEDSPTCDRPPVCSGDEIMCLHAKQLWRIDCNTRKARNVQMDAYCKRPPVCESVALGDDGRNVGCDPVEEAGLYQQWLTACKVSAMVDLMSKGGSSTGGDSGTHSRLDAIKNYLDGNGQQLDQPEVPFEQAPIESQEWSSGLSGTGTCPAPISTTVTIGGVSAPVNFSFDPLCQFANYLYAVVVTMGGLMAAFIIAGVRK